MWSWERAEWEHKKKCIESLFSYIRSRFHMIRAEKSENRVKKKEEATKIIANISQESFTFSESRKLFISTP